MNILKARVVSRTSTTTINFVKEVWFTLALQQKKFRVEMMTKILLLGIFSKNKIGRIFNTTQVKVKGLC
jgi:hypothetical protein